MKRQKNLPIKKILFSIFFFIFCFNFNINTFVRAIPGDIIYVPGDYETIQFAINNASSGSTIFVQSGIYTENLVINKPLTLIGANGKSVIDGNFTGTVVFVNSDNVSISGFTIKNSGEDFWDSGIRIRHASNCNVSFNIILNNGHGIWLDTSNNSHITNNNVTISQSGIGLGFSHGNIIENNFISSTDACGIGVDYSSGNTIINNTSIENGWGIWFFNSSSNNALNNFLINNIKQVKSDNSNNTWDGNYWNDSNFTGNSYIIDGENIDNNPLVPLANAGLDQTVDEDKILTLNGSASWSYGIISSYKWTFIDLSPKLLTGITANYTFQTPGIYSVLLNITDSFHSWVTDEVVITVLDVTLPTAEAGNNQTVKVNGEVVFDAHGSTDNVGLVNYQWDFGDETIGNSITTTHTYKEVGTYIVTLTVWDEAGNTNLDTITSTVEKNPGLPTWIFFVIGIMFVPIAFIIVKKTRNKPS
jgi:parallel beta-helix repeat protein